jgi:hypothetical protein
MWNIYICRKKDLAGIEELDPKKWKIYICRKKDLAGIEESDPKKVKDL